MRSEKAGRGRSRMIGSSRSMQGGPAIGVIGLGYWGPNLARVVSESEDARLAWLCDADESRLASLSRRYPAARVTTDAEDLYADDDLDAILIATPVFTHFDLAMRS